MYNKLDKVLCRTSLFQEGKLRFGSRGQIRIQQLRNGSKRTDSIQERLVSMKTGQGLDGQVRLQHLRKGFMKDKLFQEGQLRLSSKGTDQITAVQIRFYAGKISFWENSLGFRWTGQIKAFQVSCKTGLFQEGQFRVISRRISQDKLQKDRLDQYGRLGYIMMKALLVILFKFRKQGNLHNYDDS